MLLVLIVLSLLVFSIFILTPLIWCTLGKVFRIEDLTFKKALITCLLLTVIGVAFQIIPLGLKLFSLDNFFFDLIISIIAFVVAIVILKNRFNTTVLKAIGLHLSTIVFAVCLALFIRINVIQAFKIPSGAMEKTILVGDYVLVNKYCYNSKKPTHSDIIVFKYPNDPRKYFIKRVVAIGGDKLEIRNKDVYINGALQKSKSALYKDSRIFSDPNLYPENMMKRDNLESTEIPNDKLFVMGDNRDESNDSRFWGLVDVKAVLGKAFIIYWSWDKNTHSIRWNRIGKSL